MPRTGIGIGALYERDDMAYIVLDLEWNQCPYGKRAEDPSLPFEIIEIGAVKLDDSRRRIGTYHEIIRPLVYKKLHHCTRTVIHMSEKDFEGRRTFAEVFPDFLSWCGQDPVFCTWGPGDLAELERNLAWNIRKGKVSDRWPFPFPFFYRDVQKIFSYAYEDHRARRSLKWAVEYLHLPEEEDFHSAFSDALYTARILALLPQDLIDTYSSIDTYRTPSSRKEEIYVNYGSYRKYISRSFPDRGDIMQDSAVLATPCPVCGRRLRRKIRWFSENGRNFLSCAVCPDHGLVKGKIRLRQNGAGAWFAIRTSRLISREEYEKVAARKEGLRQKRRNHRASRVAMH